MSVRKSNWPVAISVLVIFALLLGVPFLLRPAKVRIETDLELVIISPHDEGVKVEFERGFNRWLRETGKLDKPVRIDWQNIGGGGNIIRFVESTYEAAFEKTLGVMPREKVDWVRVDGPPRPDDPARVIEIRDKMAQLSIGMDVFFGGGDYEHEKFKKNGWSAPMEPPAGLLDDVPPDLGDVKLYDPDHYWFGACLSRFGIFSNRIVCEKLNLPVPQTWTDLAAPNFRDKLAMADPNMSGSARVCYEMVLQSQGWEKGWRVLTEIAANARYFGSGSTQAALDVSRGDAAAGMVIDYYGRRQVEFVGRDEKGEFRLQYVSPEGATATTPDPISIFRGARNRRLAELFVQYVLSEPGQKLWMGKVGAPGGPEKFPLLRPPIRQSIYKSYAEHMAFPENPYTDKSGFNMNARVLGARFAILSELMRAAFITNGDLLKEAADVARAAPDSEAARLFNAPPFAEGDINKPQPDTLWGWVARMKEAGDSAERLKVERELRELFAAKYRSVIDAAGQ